MCTKSELSLMAFVCCVCVCVCKSARASFSLFLVSHCLSRPHPCISLPLPLSPMLFQELGNGNIRGANRQCDQDARGYALLNPKP